jgi:TolB protein
VARWIEPSENGAEIDAVARLILPAATAVLVAVAATASTGARAAAREPMVYGGRVPCPFARHPERCQGRPGYNGAIFVIARPGAPSRRITDRRFDDSRPSWSPDRRRIAFVRSRTPATGLQIWVMNADGAGARQITRGRIGGGPAWSPDGRWLAFAGGENRRDVFVVRPDGTGLRNVTRNPVGVAALGPTWSRDSTRIAFTRSATPVGTGVYSIGLDGRGLRRLARDGYGPNWSPDGHRIAYIRRDTATGPGWQVYTMGPNGGGKRRFTRGGSWVSPTWSPDSRRLAAVRDTSGEQLVVLRPNGTVATALTRPRRGFSIDGVDW